MKLTDEQRQRLEEARVAARAEQLKLQELADNSFDSYLQELCAELPTFTLEEYNKQQAELVAQFSKVHNLCTVADIESAIRENTISEDELVQDWIELDAIYPFLK